MFRFHRTKPEPVAAPEPAPMQEPIVEPVPDYWIGLLDLESFRAVWPRIAISDTWKKDLEPFLKRCLLETQWALMREPNPENIARFQVRAMLLHQLIELPDKELKRLQMLRDNAWGAGDYLAPNDAGGQI